MGQPPPILRVDKALRPIFTSQSWSIRGVAPEGWIEVEPGHFSGGAWPLKQLLHEAFPGQTAEIVIPQAILPRLGIDVIFADGKLHEHERACFNALSKVWGIRVPEL